MPYSVGIPALNCAGGSLITFGNMKRPVAASDAAVAAVKAVHATPIHARRPMSGEVSSPAFAAAAGTAGFLAVVAAGVVILPARSAAGTAGGAGGRGGAGLCAVAAAGGAAATLPPPAGAGGVCA